MLYGLFLRVRSVNMNHDRVMDILNNMIIEIDEALIKAKAQMEYVGGKDEKK